MKVEAKTHQQVWIERFEGTLQNPFSHTRQWVETGVSKGLVSDDDQGRLRLAREMAQVMSFVLPERQPERFIEDLDFSKMGLDPNRAQKVASLMVEVGAVISQKKREAIKQRKY